MTLSKGEAMLTVYSKTNCPACVNTKVLLEKYQIPFEEVNMDKDQTAKEFIISEGHRQAPQIYKGKDVFIQGGYLGLMKMTESDIKKLLYGA